VVTIRFTEVSRCVVVKIPALVKPALMLASIVVVDV